MSAEIVTTIIRRAVAEPEFRTALFQNAAAALAGYDLADAERTAPTGLAPENFDALAGELEARVSKAGFGLPSDSSSSNLVIHWREDLG